MASSLGLRLGAEDSRKICEYFELLLRWNQTINLTGASSIRELLDEHFLDSAALALLFPAGRVVDVGAGGGLPGIAFGILRRDCILTLVEPRRRRAAFLRTALRELGLPGTVVESRLESFPRHELFAAGFSRATFAPLEWIKRAPGVIEPGGQIGVLTTPDEAVALSKAGYEAAGKRVYRLPDGRVREVLAFLVPRGTK